MDNDDDFRFALLQGRISTEIQNAEPGLARRLLELEIERSQIIDREFDRSRNKSISNIYDKPYIERKPNFKQIERNFESPLELPSLQQAVNVIQNTHKEEIQSWIDAKTRLQNSAPSVNAANKKAEKQMPRKVQKSKRDSPQDKYDNYDTSNIINQLNDFGNQLKKRKLEEEESVSKRPFGSALDLFVENQVISKKMSGDFAKQILENKHLMKGKKKEEDSEENEILKQFDPKIVEQIKASIPDKLDDIGWDSVAGLEDAKRKIQQVAILPLIRPEFFTGIRKPPKGILLFGPPGTGKTMIGKCIAAQAKAKFFSITAASITSKWMGESEKTMKALFAVARLMKPSVIFVDEIDSLLTTRSSGENDCTIRVKTEFLSQFNGLESDDGDRLLVIGTTNRPEELDRAVLRRFSVRLLISLPNAGGRKQMLESHLKEIRHTLTEEEIDDIVAKTDGYVGSDMYNLAQAAAMMPIHHMDQEEFLAMNVDDIRPVSHEDFLHALSQVPASFDKSQLGPYLEWNRQYGTNFN